MSNPKPSQPFCIESPFCMWVRRGGCIPPGCGGLGGCKTTGFVILLRKLKTTKKTYNGLAAVGL